MAWTYSGNPADSDKDRYRFLIADTIPTEPVLQDEEIEFVLSEYSDENTRLCHLFDRAADFMARSVKRRLGPQDEDPTKRTEYFKEKADYYRNRMNAAGLSLPKCSRQSFRKGMHDNVRGY